MNRRLRSLGLVLAVVGILFVGAGAFAFHKTQEGARSLEAFSAAQDVRLSYNEAGQLVDRGEPDGAQAILALLTDEWGYPVAMGDLDPADPLVNTPTEYMYQMATVAYHVMHRTQTVVLAEDAEYNGELFPAGEYQFAVDGRYWTGFDRQHPIEGAAREKAWTGTAHALIANLGVGTVTASALQLGLALAGLFAGVGALALLSGIGLVWVARAQEETQVALVPRLEPVPA